METKINVNSKEVQDAIIKIADFFETEITYKELMEELADGMLELLSMSVYEELNGDKRLYNLVLNASCMARLLKPFADIINK